MNYKSICTALIPALLALFTYRNTLGYSFVYDDYLHIVSNRKITPVHESLSAFSEPTPPGNLYRPVLILSYALNYTINGLDPYYFHLVNIILHALNVVLLWLILSKVVPREIAFTAACLVAVNPVCSEAVTNISGRSEVLTHFLGLSSLYTALLYTDKRTTRFPALLLALTTALSLLALFCKESALVYPLLFALCCVFRDRNVIHTGRVKVSGVTACAAVAFYMACRIAVTGPYTAASIPFVENPLVALSWHERLVNACYLLTCYLIKMLLPLGLSADYSYAHFVPLAKTLSYLYALYIIIPFLLLCSGVTRAQDRNPAGLLILWFFIPFSVTSNIFFPIGTVFAERLTYLPLAGIMGTLAYFLTRIAGRKISVPVLIAYGAFLCAANIRHTPVWADNFSLWQHQMSVAPRSAKASANYGAALYDKGEYETALYYLHLSFETDPHAYGAYRVLGQAFQAMGKYSEAEEAFRKGLSLNPEDRLLRAAYRHFLKTREKHPRE